MRRSEHGARRRACSADHFEAVRALPPELTNRYSEIEWGKVAGIGNILRHEYERVDPNTMWRIATVELPKLENVILKMLSELDG